MKTSKILPLLVLTLAFSVNAYASDTKVVIKNSKDIFTDAPIVRILAINLEDRLSTFTLAIECQEGKVFTAVNLGVVINLDDHIAVLYRVGSKKAVEEPWQYKGLWAGKVGKVFASEIMGADKFAIRFGGHTTVFDLSDATAQKKTFLETCPLG